MDRIHCGWLTKSPPESKNHGLGRIFKSQWRRRFFVLYAPPLETNTLTRQGQCAAQLDYYDSDRCTNRKGSINLAKCDEVMTSLDSTFYKHMFALHTVDCKGLERTYHLAADTETEMEKWAEVLCSLLGLLDNKEATTKPDPGRSASIATPRPIGYIPSVTTPLGGEFSTRPHPLGAKTTDGLSLSPPSVSHKDPERPARRIRTDITPVLNPPSISTQKSNPASPIKPPHEEYINLNDCVSDTSTLGRSAGPRPWEGTLVGGLIGPDPPPRTPPRPARRKKSVGPFLVANEPVQGYYNTDNGVVRRENSEVDSETGGGNRSGVSSEGSSGWGTASDSGGGVMDREYDTPQSFLGNHNLSIRTSSDDCFSEDEPHGPPPISLGPRPSLAPRGPPSQRPRGPISDGEGIFEGTYDRLPSSDRGRKCASDPHSLTEDQDSIVYDHPHPLSPDDLYDIPQTLNSKESLSADRLNDLGYGGSGGSPASFRGSKCSAPPPTPHSVKIHQYVNASSGQVSTENLPTPPPKLGSHAAGRGAGFGKESNGLQNKQFTHQVAPSDAASVPSVDRGSNLLASIEEAGAQVTPRTRSFKRSVPIERPPEPDIQLPTKKGEQPDDSSDDESDNNDDDDDDDDDDVRHDYKTPPKLPKPVSQRIDTVPPAPPAVPPKVIQYVDLDLEPSKTILTSPGSASLSAPSSEVRASTMTSGTSAIQYTEIDSVKTEALIKVKHSVEENYSRSSTPTS